MKLYTDNPISSLKDEKFGFLTYARVLSTTLLESGPLPFCVGIFGAWGSGKSSFMKMIQLLIQNKPEVRSIWFNPWKYDKKEELWSALIQTILSTIIVETDHKPEIKEKAKLLAKTVTWMVLKKAVTTVSAGIVTEPDLDTIAKTMTDKDEIYYQYVNNFEQDFSFVVERYTDNGKLVIFIDDLDRCLPENAITVLESLKLFIGDARCIFVLGMDHYIVEEGIRQRYTNKVTMNGRDYLDKIIQIPFYLPPVHYKTLEASLKADEASARLSEEVWTIIHAGMEGNPRKTRRFVNCFNLVQSYLRAPTRDEILSRGDIPILPEKTQNIYLAKLLVFQISFPDFYVHLNDHPEDWEFLETNIIQAANLEQREKSLDKNPELQKLLQDHPKLQVFMRRTVNT
ncbi:MAG TPA: P-loop NTPase fold protein, partial [Methylomirabilota bacterium]|nr:P-loop NTPase fold protein [Methylomirabilota bacterium]